ncbi:MAG TPA: carboxylating nicotinate-nucleotide diphosphorylase [Candidatus Acidoferrales bacterium]|nr:carboxylating nicotinate-nucleotide diphosphorylase [Candidatus Acidoferrales bacterium]
MSSITTEKVELATRDQLVCSALYRGEALALANPLYSRAVRALTEELLRQDCEAGDLTVEAIGLNSQHCAMEIRAKEAGVAAGIAEAIWLYDSHGLRVTCVKRDGEAIQPGDVLLSVEGDAHSLFSLERTAVNLLQRMSGIASATRRLVSSAHAASPAAHVVATRKTPWGLIDKRAVHLGGGGTHRLHLGDAILIKTNHLALASNGLGMNLEAALRQAWQRRKQGAFVEVEVTNGAEAITAASVFAELQVRPDTSTCLLLLDNFSAEDAKTTVYKLRGMNLHDAVLVEASGGVSDESVAAYAAAGVDAISVGALTHSVRALDLSAKLISRGEVASA